MLDNKNSAHLSVLGGGKLCEQKTAAWHWTDRREPLGTHTAIRVASSTCCIKVFTSPATGQNSGKCITVQVSTLNPGSSTSELQGARPSACTLPWQARVSDEQVDLGTGGDPRCRALLRFERDKGSVL